MSSFNFTISVSGEDFDRIKEMLASSGRDFESEGMTRSIRLIIQKAWAHHSIVAEQKKPAWGNSPQ